MLIDECIDVINQYFPDNWIEALKISTDEEKAQSYLNVTTRANSAAVEFFKKINSSILAAEYLQNDIEQSFENVLGKLNDAANINQDSPGDDFFNEINNVVLNGFISRLKKAVSHYKRLYNSLKHKYSHPEKVVFLDAIKREPNNGDFEELVDVQKTLNGFLLNINLAQLDHNLEVKPSTLRELILIHSSLKEKKNQSSDIYEILFDKSCFLIYKLLTRFNEDKRNFLYAIDFEDKDLKKEDFQTNEFKYLEEITNLHYVEIGKADLSHLRKHINPLIQKKQRGEKLSFEEYHFLIKFYKDGNSSEQSLNALYDQFLIDYQILELSTSSFDTRAFRISKNYLKNNILSFHIHFLKSDLDTISSIIEEIRFLQSETEVKNYFPYLKACQYFIKILENELTLFAKKGINESKVQRVIDLLEVYEKALYENFDWCKERSFLAFQPPLSECIKQFKYKGKEDVSELFLSSSIVLPINYEQVKKEMEEVHREIIKNKTIYEIHKSISGEKEKIEQIKESIDKTDKKHVEILSVFAAIVIFASASVQIFTKGATFNDALRFMLVFGYGLTLFVILIWLITRGAAFEVRRVPLVHRWLIGILCLSSIVALIITFIPTEKTTSNSNADLTKPKNSLPIHSPLDSPNKNRSTLSKLPDTAKLKKLP